MIHVEKGNDTAAERKKNLPIGIENFEEIRTNDFYYFDKWNGAGSGRDLCGRLHGGFR